MQTRNSHLEKYISLNSKTFTKNGQRHKIHISGSIIKFPYKCYSYSGAIENLDCADEYRFSCLENYESFDCWVGQLEKMLNKNS